ncbi:MAG: deoxyribose-phosphate aldolase [Gammaproteobacteria bacterium]
MVNEAQRIIAQRLIPLIDLTLLTEHDDHGSVEGICMQAMTGLGHVAAVCIWPEFVSFVKDILSETPVRIASVANFPNGDDKTDHVLKTIAQAIRDGADEMDVVMPYQKLLAGEIDAVRAFIKACKISCGHQIKLKIILETGALADNELITQASELAIASGADFLKTSTGYHAVGATPIAAELMLKAIKSSGRSNVGFKASGGIKTLEQAQAYLILAEKIMGKEWVSPHTFRIGSSSLLANLLD